MPEIPKFKSFQEFYPYYLSEHTNKTNRILHFIGTTIIIILLAFLILTKNIRMIWLCPLIAYGFAWIGHFVFEKNRPATFKHPFYSLRGDFVMWWQLLTKKIFF